MNRVRDQLTSSPALQEHETWVRDQFDSVDQPPEAMENEPAAASEAAHAARSYAQRGRYDLAITYAQRAVAYDPENPRLLVLLGSMLEAGGQRERAQEVYRAEMAVRENPRDAQPWLGLARRAREQGQLSIAAQYAYRALDPTFDAEVLAELVQILLQEGHVDSASAILAPEPQWAPGVLSLM